METTFEKGASKVSPPMSFEQARVLAKAEPIINIIRGPQGRRWQIGIFLGRFQPFHIGHYLAVRKMAKRVDLLTIAVGSAQEGYTRTNPFTYQERERMICDSTACFEGVSVVPIIDIHAPDRYARHVSLLVGPFDVVFSGNAMTLDMFRADSDVDLCRICPGEAVAGTLVRELIAESNGAWHELVPPEVMREIYHISGDERIRYLQRYGEDTVKYE